MVRVELEGVTKQVPDGEYNQIVSLSKFLYGLTDINLPDRKAAKWALNRAVQLLAQLKMEAGKI